MQPAEIAVVGAGLAGACTALELARRGHGTLLLDCDERPMNRTSLRNEGKIHLGLIYAGDATLRTAALQLRGALTFRRLLERWLGEGVGRIAVSAPFTYLVAGDSILAPAELRAHYDRLERRYLAACADRPELDYLGTHPERFAVELDMEELGRYFRDSRFQTAFATPELAIDPADLSREIRHAVEREPLITFAPGSTVRELDGREGYVRLSGSGLRGTWRVDAGQVVNAAGASRLALDRQLAVDAPAGWLHRLKYRLIARLPAALRSAPSATMVVGRYGDVVVRPDGTAYLSWYPAGLRGWSHEVEPPAEWSAACRGEVPPDVRARLIPQLLEGIEAWYPGIGASEPLLLDAGVIGAYGSTDVDDRTSTTCWGASIATSASSRSTTTCSSRRSWGGWCAASGSARRPCSPSATWTPPLPTATSSSRATRRSTAWSIPSNGRAGS